MAALVVSLLGFDDAEAEKLPQSVINKIEKYIIDQQEKFQELEQNCVDYEKKYTDVSDQMTACNSALKTESQISADLRKQLSDLREQYGIVTEDLQKLQEKQLEVEREYEKTKNSNNLLLDEKKSLTELLDRREHDIDKLNGEWKTISEQLTRANAAKIEALANFERVESENVTLKHHESRVNQEKEQLQQQNEWLEKQLKDKINSVLTIRKDQSSKILELQAQFEEKKDQVTDLEEMVACLKETNESLAKRLDKNIEKLKEVRESQAHVEEQFRNEILAQEKLLLLYKGSTDEGEAKVQELIKAVKELQRLLKTASEAHSELEKQKEEEAKAFHEEIHQRDERIERQEKELKHANEVIEEARRKGAVPLTDEGVESMFPSAAAASRLLNSGMTLTQIYSEYVETMEKLHLEKEENKRLNEYLDQILREIEEKAPMMRRQREEYEKSLETLGCLERQLENARKECEQSQRTADEAERNSKHLIRENSRLQRQAGDLGQQVRVLVKELEEARGTVVSMREDDSQLSSSEVSSSSRIISSKLVSFRSIEELQEQNQRLLQVVRELSDQKEEEEESAVNCKTKEYQAKLELFQKELEHLRAERESQMQMIESVIQQKEMYKVLLRQHDSAILPVLDPHTSITVPSQPSPNKQPTSPDERGKALQETNTALKELKEKMSIFATEKIESDKILNEQLDNARKEASDLRVTNSKLSSQLDFAQDRFKVLQSNVEGYKKEIAGLREKNQKSSMSVMKHEQMVNTLRQDLMTSQEKLVLAEVQIQNLRSERDQLKGIEARLSQEKENIMREKRSQNELLANLEIFQSNMKAMEYENRTRFQKEIDRLQRETASLERQLENKDSQQRSFIATLERQLNDSRQQRDREQELHKKTQINLENAGKLIKSLKIQVSKATQQAAKSPAKPPGAEKEVTQKQDPVSELLQKRDDSAMHEYIFELETRVKEKDSQIKSLTEQRDQAKEHEVQNRSRSQEFEKKIIELTKNMKEFKEMSDSRLSNLEAEKAELEARVEKSKKKKVPTATLS